MPVFSKVKRYLLYPSKVSLRDRELQITANHDDIRSVLSRLNDLSQAYRGLLGGLAATLFLINWQFQFTPWWAGPVIWSIIILASILAAVRIRVVARAETTTAVATTPEASVTTEEDDIREK